MASKKTIIKYNPVTVDGNVYNYPVLSPKLESFAMQLIPCKLNLAEAIRRSEYATKDSLAYKHGSQLWARQDLREWLSVHLERLKDQLPKDAQDAINEIRIVKELVAIAYTHIGQIVDWDESGQVTVKTKDELTDAELASIKKVKCEIFETVNDEGSVTSRRTKIELEQHAKLTAIDMLAKLKWDWYKRVGGSKSYDDDQGKKRGYIVVPQPEKRIN